MAEDNKPDMYYFCADHAFTQDQVTIGGLAMTGRSVDSVTASLKKIKSRNTLSWDELDTKNIAKAQNFLDEFAMLLGDNKAHLHLRFTSTQQVDIIHKMELSERVKIAHLYYHLILQRPFRFYSSKYSLHIRPANEDVEHILEKMRVRIHKDAFDLYGSRQDPITSLKTQRITDHPINEMLALIISALTFMRHQKDGTDDITEAQRNFLSSCQKAIQPPNLFGNSGAMEQRFSIWNDAPSLEHTGFRGLF